MREEPRGLCVDVGNVVLMPDVSVVADMLRAALDGEVDQQRFHESIVLADRDGHLTPDPAAFWDGDDMALSWGGHIGLGAEDAKRIWARLGELDDRGPGVWTRVNPEAEPVLAALRARGVRLAAVSNAAGHVAAELSAAGLAEYFDTIIDSTTVGMAKPDPRVFLAAARALDVPPAECWHIEDTAYELSGVVTAGFGLAVHYDPLGVYEGMHSYRRVSSLADLLDLVRTGA